MLMAMFCHIYQSIQLNVRRWTFFFDGSVASKIRKPSKKPFLWRTREFTTLIIAGARFHSYLIHIESCNCTQQSYDRCFMMRGSCKRVRVGVRGMQCNASASKEAWRWRFDMTRVTRRRLGLLWYGQVAISCMLVEERLFRVNESHRTSNQTFGNPEQSSDVSRSRQRIITPAIVLCYMYSRRRHMYIYHYGRGRLTNSGMPALSNA
jgi:hypothetical protein